MVGWTTLRVAHAPNHRPPAAHKLHRAPPRRVEQGKTNNQRLGPALGLRAPDSCQLRRHITLQHDLVPTIFPAQPSTDPKPVTIPKSSVTFAEMRTQRA